MTQIRGGNFVIKDGKALLKYKTRQIVSSEEDFKYKPVEELGFKKEVVGNVIFMREGLSMATLKTYVGYFVQKVRIAIPNRRTLKYSYLYVPPSLGGIVSSNRLHIRHFAHDRTASLSMREIEENEITFERIGKPKRISQQTKNKLMLQDDFLGIYKDEKLDKELIEI